MIRNCRRRLRCSGSGPGAGASVPGTRAPSHRRRPPSTAAKNGQRGLAYRSNTITRHPSVDSSSTTENPALRRISRLSTN